MKTLTFKTYTGLSRHQRALRYLSFASVMASRVIARSGFPIAQGTRARLLTEGLSLNHKLNRNRKLSVNLPNF